MFISGFSERLLSSADAVLANFSSGALVVGVAAPGAESKKANLPLSFVTIGVSPAGLGFSRLRFVCKPEAGQRRAGHANAESPQCRAACDGLGQAPCEFIEFVVHAHIAFSFRFFAFEPARTFQNPHYTLAMMSLRKFSASAVSTRYCTSEVQVPRDVTATSVAVPEDRSIQYVGPPESPAPVPPRFWGGF